MEYAELSETLKAAEEYSVRLKNLQKDLENAELQIASTAEETEEKINREFASLGEYLTNALNSRRDRLIEETRSIRSRGIAPLRECQAVVAENLLKTSEFMSDGRALMNNNGVLTSENYNDRASLLGSLPEVPELKDVPFVSFQADSNAKNDLFSVCSGYGSVSRIAPIQINAIIERPGSLLVAWDCVDNKYHISDISKFRLQKVSGNVLSEPHLNASFVDCYTGTELHFLAKDLQPNQNYSFRVCCKFKVGTNWSPWSLPQSLSTHIRPYCWENNEKFALANENRIARSTSESPSLLKSSGLQFRPGYSLEFTFLECDTRSNDTFVGLCTSRGFSDVDEGKEIASFLIGTKGDVRVNGSEKATKLPEIRKGGKVNFVYDKVLSDNRARITVDVMDKSVTYDWTTRCEEDAFYFLARFGSSKWKILVE